MSLKESNEITVKIKCELNEFYKIVKEKGFKIIDKFSMDDTYFIPEEVNVDKILNKRTNKEREKSCGCIITKDNKVLLIKQTKGHWGFPKGHVEKNETEIETAIREVKEETNLDVEIDANKRYTMEYVTDKGKLKQVVLFIAKCIGGEIKAQECEVTDIKWLDFDEAIETITYDNTRELFKEILKERKI